MKSRMLVLLLLPTPPTLDNHSVAGELAVPASASPTIMGPINDCNTDGIDDAIDIAGVTSSDCNSNAVPDECDIAAAQLAKLVAADAAADDQFGRSVAVSGDTAVVGAGLAVAYQVGENRR